MKKTILFFVAYFCIIGSLQNLSAQITYEAKDDGAWNSALTWSPEGVPGENDIAYNPGSFEISISGDVTVGEYHQVGGYLYINGSLTILNGGSWENGHIVGSGSPANAQINIPEGVEFIVNDGNVQGKLLNGIELKNLGTITVIEGFAPLGGTVVNNYGLFSISTDAYFGSSGPSDGTFNNYGTVLKSGGTVSAQLAHEFIFYNYNGTIEILAGKLVLYGDATFINGQYNISAGAEFMLNGGDYLFEGTLNGAPEGDFSMTGSGNVIIPQDSTVTLNITNNGALWAGAVIKGGGTLLIPEGAVLKSVYSGSARILSENTTILNQGTFLATIGFAQYDGSSIINEGTFEVTENCNFGSSGPTDGIFDNYGTFVKTGGESSTNFAAGVTFTNHNSEIDIQVGKIQAYGNWNLIDGIYNLAENTELNFAGNLHLEGTLQGISYGDFILASADVVVETDATLNFQGNGVQWSGSDIMGGGTLTNAETGLVQIVYGGSGRFLTGNTTFVNEGNVEATLGIVIQDGAVFRNEGLFEIRDNVQFSGGGSPEGMFENYGTLIKNAGDGNSNWQANLDVQNRAGGIIDASMGTLRFYALANNEGGIVQGTATVYVPDNFSNEGIVAPGQSPGLLNWKIDYELESTAILDIELGGLSAGAEYDQLAVTGNANLGGALHVNLAGDFIPEMGDSFVILTTTGTLMDTFEIVQPQNDLFISVQYNSDNVTLVIDSVGSLSVGEDINEELTAKAMLKQNYPNPFNQNTLIDFLISEPEIVKLMVFNSHGKLVETLVSRKFDVGEHSVVWNAGNYPPGYYFYRIEVGSKSEVKKMMLVR